MKCTECGNKMTRSVVDHVYRESGLDNVILHGITRYRCESCGAERVQIPNMGPLHRAIARAIAHKPARLVPAEVRFLRDHLELSNKDFAALMGVTPEQASRWTSSEPIGVPAERFLRTLALLGPGVVSLDQGDDREDDSLPDPELSPSLFKALLRELPPPSTAPREVPIDLRRAPSGWKLEAHAAS
ncbi:MAG TPA: YgiT-type zinc finger protein [Kofleriaceae bacterium]